jgi:hypothetical protein
MRGMAKADFYTALFLMVLGIAVVEESWRMPRFADLGSSIWSAPGTTPGMVGAVLAIMGAILFFRSRREMRAATAGGGAGFDKSGWTRAGYTLLLCLVYGIGLIGRIPFQLASFLFMLAFIVSFDFYDNRDAYRDRLRMLRRIAVAAAIAGVAAWTISKIFQDVFFVRLP